MSAPELFKIAKDLTRMQVNASIDESDIGRIKPGQKVQFTVDAYPTEKFSGKVSQVRLNPVVEQNVVSYVTIIDVPNPELKLKPGMTATVTVEVARADDVVRVPNAALRFRPGKDGPPRVWTLQDGNLRPVRVQTGISDGTATAITGGELADGTPVVTGMAAAATASGAPATSPLLPFGGRRPGSTNNGSGRQGGTAGRPTGAGR
jgi:HlyD family secretion protein